MNLSTSICALLFFVGLGGIIVAQQLQIRSTNYHIGKTEKQILETDEQIRVLNKKHEEAQNPSRLWERVKQFEMPLVPPEYKEEPQAPGKPKTQASADKAKPEAPAKPKTEKRRG